MANEVLWKAPVNVAAPIDTATAIASNAGVLGSEYDNETNKKRFASFEIHVTHPTAPIATRVWFLYLVYANDGTNYEDGSGSLQPAKLHVHAFQMRNVNTAQILTCSVPLRPFKFKPLLWNDTDQSSSSAGGAAKTTLNMEVYGEDIQ